MTLYTSYYANWRKFPEAACLVQISRTAPPNTILCKGYSFFPDEDLLVSYKNKKINEKEYEKRYRKHLNSLKEDNSDIMFLLNKQIEGVDTLLLCYEGKDKFCHRHILANWLNEHYGLDIQEFSTDLKFGDLTK